MVVQQPFNSHQRNATSCTPSATERPNRRPVECASFAFPSALSLWWSPRFKPLGEPRTGGRPFERGRTHLSRSRTRRMPRNHELWGLGVTVGSLESFSKEGKTWLDGPDRDAKGPPVSRRRMLWVTHWSMDGELFRSARHAALERPRSSVTRAVPPR